MDTPATQPPGSPGLQMPTAMDVLQAVQPGTAPCTMPPATVSWPRLPAARSAPMSWPTTPYAAQGLVPVRAPEMVTQPSLLMAAAPAPRPPAKAPARRPRVPRAAPARPAAVAAPPPPPPPRELPVRSHLGSAEMATELEEAILVCLADPAFVDLTRAVASVVTSQLLTGP